MLEGWSICVTRELANTCCLIAFKDPRLADENVGGGASARPFDPLASLAARCHSIYRQPGQTRRKRDRPARHALSQQLTNSKREGGPARSSERPGAATVLCTAFNPLAREVDREAENEPVVLFPFSNAISVLALACSLECLLEQSPSVHL